MRAGKVSRVKAPETNIIVAFVNIIYNINYNILTIRDRHWSEACLTWYKHRALFNITTDNFSNDLLGQPTTNIVKRNYIGKI